jgi:hypothetical protein
MKADHIELVARIGSAVLAAVVTAIEIVRAVKVPKPSK